MQNMPLETALFVGDWPTYSAINALCKGGLVTYDPAPFHFPSFAGNERSGFDMLRLNLTKTGRSVFDGEQDTFGLMKRDSWLGGVELLTSGAI